jgi:hypothetical protein
LERKGFPIHREALFFKPGSRSLEIKNEKLGTEKLKREGIGQKLIG